MYVYMYTGNLTQAARKKPTIVIRIKEEVQDDNCEPPGLYLHTFALVLYIILNHY